MSVEPVPSPKTARPPTATAAVWLSALGLVCFLLWVGSRIVFSQFQRYDDEGYLLITVQQFLAGHPLYDAVYTQYGPAYYLWEQLLHSVFGVPLTHDATRSVTLLVWLVCSGLVAWPVWLVTQRLGLAALGAAVAFFHMTQLAFEPGHPQELCLLAVMGSLSFATYRLVVHGRLGILPATAIGALVAVAFLTKVNIGIFLAGATALGLATSLRPYAVRGTLVKLIIVASLAGVAGVMFRDLTRSDVASLVLIVWIGLLAVVLADAHEPTPQGVVSLGEVVACAAGFAVAAAGIVGSIIQAGTSPRALVEGLFILPLGFPSVFWQELPVPLLAVAVAPMWLVVAECYRRNVAAVQSQMPLVALFLGQAIFLLSAVRGFAILFAFGPPLVWMVLRDDSSSGGGRAARRLLAFVAIFYSLQVYPTPEGTQIALGTVLYLPFSLIAIADAERELRKGRAPVVRSPSRGRRAIAAALVVLVAAIVGGRYQLEYMPAVPLGMPGAAAVRAPAKEAARIWWLATNLRAHCDRFLSAPGLNSLHFWTGLPPVSTLNTTLWPLLWEDRQQRRVLEAAAPVERLCVAWEPRIMAYLMSQPNSQSGPLAEWLARNFEPLAMFDRWEFRVRHGTEHPRLYQGQWLDGGDIELTLPPLGGMRVSRIAVVDGATNQTMADTATANGLVVIDERGERIAVEGGIDVSIARRVALRGAARSLSAEPVVVVRFWTRSGESAATVPVVDFDARAAEPSR